METTTTKKEQFDVLRILSRKFILIEKRVSREAIEPTFCRDDVPVDDFSSLSESACVNPLNEQINFVNQIDLFVSNSDLSGENDRFE